MIELKNITKIINNNKILSDINITFDKKGLVVILGESGCGKTTLLNLIAKNDIPSEGKIEFHGNDIRNISSEYYHNSLVSYIYQNYNLIDNISTIDNIELPLKIKNKKYINKNIFYKTKINRLLKTKSNLLSGGEAQRVAICRGLVTDSKVLLADEPTGALDSKNSIKIMELLKETSKNKLVIMVTHNEHLALKYADRIIRLKDGKIIEDTNPITKTIKTQIKEKKLKVKIKELIKLSILNLKKKRIRNILLVISFTICLISLALSLSLNNGFSKELDNLLETELYSYPLIISKESNKKYTLPENQITNNEININEYEYKNNINEELILKINNLKENTNGISFYKESDELIKIGLPNPGNNMFELIKGEYSEKENEIMLLIDTNNSIDEIYTNIIKINSNNYNDYINKKFIFNSKEYIITGIVKSNNAYLKEINGIIYNSSNSQKDINSIYLYPKSQLDKITIKNILNEYNIIDEAEELNSITKTLINSITIILLTFSLVSLIITIIMFSTLSYINVLERIKEIGILKSLGARNKDIRNMFFIENGIIGLRSLITSILIVYELSAVINPLINDYINIEKCILLNYKIVLILIVLTLIICKVTSYFSSISVSKKQISEILK